MGLSVSIVLMMALSFTCISCSQLRDIKQNDPFRKLYTASLSSQSRGGIGQVQETPLLNLSCYQMPLSLFCRILSDKFSIGMVYAENLSQKVITSEFKNTDLISVLNVISRQLSVDIVRVGNTYFIGSLRPEDRGILVRRVLGYDSAELQSIVSSMLSSTGKSSVMAKSSVVVVADHESVVRRVSEMLDYLDSVDTPTWILQLCFVILRKDALTEAGFDVTSSGTISYNISENSLDFKDFKLDGILNLVQNSTFADIYASPMLLVRDGTTAKWKDGKRVPIPKKTVSSYGVVTVSGYDYTDVGFIVDATVRQSKRGGRVTLKIEKSDIASYVEEAPLTTQSVYDIDVDMEPLTPYLLGELSLFKVLDTQDNIANFGRDRGKSVIQLWGQLYKVSGAVRETFNPHKDKEKDIKKDPPASGSGNNLISNLPPAAQPGRRIRYQNTNLMRQKIIIRSPRPVPPSSRALRMDNLSEQFGVGGVPLSIGGKTFFQK